ncbi:MAG: conjugal transfer protein TraD [Rhodanobacter sp.]|nr:conjugal transfer protein TraD [Rhodanobacter sp.]
MLNTEKQRAKIEKLKNAMAAEQAKLLLAERAAKVKKQRAEARARSKERASLFRSADAHRKIVLGGLIIAAHADTWDEAEIVGGLLVIADKLLERPELRAQLREKGIQHLEARKAARAKP